MESNNISIEEFTNVFSSFDDNIKEMRQSLDEETNNLLNDETIKFIVVFSGLFSLSNEDFHNIGPFILDSVKKSLKTPSTINYYRDVLSTGVTTTDGIASALDAVFKTIFESVEANGTEISEEKRGAAQSFIIEIKNFLSSIETEDVIQVPIELTSENAKIPTFAHEGDAGCDLYSTIEADINPGEQIMVPLDIKMEIPKGYALLVQPRSGQSAKTKLRICNTPGLIDSDYRGNIGVLVENIEAPIQDISVDDDGKIGISYGRSFHIDKGQRIAQGRFVKVPTITFIQIDKVNETARGEGGFGSTGKM
jgi:dUTP pyrophosphatase